MYIHGHKLQFKKVHKKAAYMNQLIVWLKVYRLRIMFLYQ